MRIALDIDDVLADFLGEYAKRFDVDQHPERMCSEEITKNVRKLRKDRDFWLSLGLKCAPDFEPVLYCTKRINPKSYTKTWLAFNNLPMRPVYQLLAQGMNKADKIKGRCDVLIDDSYYNVIQSIQAGLPALLFTTPENKQYDFPYRINSLQFSEIERVYNKETNGKQRIA